MIPRTVELAATSRQADNFAKRRIAREQSHACARRPHPRFLPFSPPSPSFPRKRESTDQQRHPRESGDKLATRNQVQIPTSGSHLPLWANRGRLPLNSIGLPLRRRSQLPPSFPRKRESRRLATRNQVQTAASASLLPLWAYRGRFGFSSFWRTHEPRGRGERRTKLAIRNQVRIAASGSLLPLREKARMSARRAQARLRGRDARAPVSQICPCNSINGEGIY